MKINRLKINSYGKLKNKEVELKDNINIIYGKNESGKSTLLKFIVNSFYGISKNKKGKELSDVEKYTPWIGEEFSGKLEYQLDDKSKFEIFRDFKKKNPKIFNQDMVDISKEFNIDKNKGNEFFYEQTSVDEQLFLSTIVTNQEEIKLEKNEQNILIQKIANLVGTGDDNISYKRAIDRINRRQLDEVGTSRSREKPINVLSKKIEELENEKLELENYENFKYEIEEQNSEIKNDIFNLENEKDFLKEIKKIKEDEIFENEKIKIKENIKNENNEKINLIKNKINELNKNNFSENKKEKNKKILVIFLILILINILQFIFIKNNIFNYIFLLTVPTLLIFYIILKTNKKNRIKIIQKNKLEEIKLEKNNLNNEINILEKNNNEIESEIKNIKNNLNLKINSEMEKIKNNYLNKIENYKINYYINLKDKNLELENLQNEINDKKIKLHQLELEKKNIEPKLENLSKVEEQLVNNKEKMVNLENLNNSIELAKEALSECYEKMKNTVTPKFTEKLSKNISKITNGKYNNVIFNDDDGLIVEIEDGNYVSASKLSIGTIDQLYLSLRLSMVEDLSSEKMPIILDESFAFSDNERLENILKYIYSEFSNHQIIIFTCTEREMDILNKNNIKFNLVKL